MSRKKSSYSEPKKPQTLMECIDQLQKLSADKQRYENDLVDYMNKYPQGSAPGLVDVIGEYRHKMEEVMTIMERLNQSSTSG